MTARTLRVLQAVVCFSVLAVALTWPLALHLRTALPGDPAGDTGVYVWNLWIFSHELFAHGRPPLSTDHIFAFTGGADFSLHNYTPIAGLLAVPLLPVLGIVGAYNVVMWLALVTSGLGAWALARYCGLGAAASVICGAVFMSMPLVSARETAHLSLVTNGALPLFLLALFRTLDRPTMWRGALVGGMVAVAIYSDAYYGVFCVLMGAFVLCWRFVHLSAQGPTSGAGLRWVNGGIALVAGILIVAVASGRESIDLLGVSVRGLRHPYTVVTALSVLVLVRGWLRFRPKLGLRPVPKLVELSEAACVAVVICLLCLTPVLAGLVARLATGRMPSTPILWRSSPRGVDVLSYLVPNPTHAVIGQWTERWLLPPVEDAFPELVASCSVILFAVLVWSHRRHPLPRIWLAFTATFALLSFGPFVYVAGVNTMVPGPWALLRYVPLIGMARSPSRFALVVALGLAMLAGAAADAWLSRRQRASQWGVACAAVLVALEVLPGTRVLHSADVPQVYSLIASDPNERSRVLVLPTGIRDGTSSVGDFNASTAYFQTVHRHPLLGGYLSRVSDWRRTESQRSPILRALYELSEGASDVDPVLRARALRSRETFLARSCLGYVVIDRMRTSDGLRRFAIDTLALVSVHADARFELLVPSRPPKCDGAFDVSRLRRD